MKLSALAIAVEARVIGDGDIDIERVAHVESAGAADVAIIAHAHDRHAALTTHAGAVVVDIEFAADRAHELPCAVLAVDKTPRALRLALDALRAPPASLATSIDATARVASSAVVEDGVVIGARAVVMHNAVIRAGSRIGADARIGPGCVIGDDGFAFDDDAVPIVGAYGVVIGDGSWLGANVCVDRGLVRDTVLGAGCRVDNLVQIGHDVVLGAGCVLVAQTGLSGFGTFGDGVTFGGQAGANPHVKVAARVRVGGQAGVTNDVDVEGAVVAGTPAFAHHAWLKAMAQVKRLGQQKTTRRQ